MKNGFKIIIYKHTSISTGKCYIGLTCNSLQTRFQGHLNASRRGSVFKFHKALAALGEDDFISEIIDECDDIDTAKILEQKYIVEFDSFKNGYNSTIGGDGCYIKTKESVEKWRKTISEKYDSGELVSPLSDPLIHKKTIETRSSRGTNVWSTDNPMKDPVRAKEIASSRSGLKHYLTKKYKYFIMSPTGIKSEIQLIGNLASSLSLLDLSIAVFNKHCNKDTSPSRGPFKDYKFFKYENY